MLPVVYKWIKEEVKITTIGEDESGVEDKINMKINPWDFGKQYLQHRFVCN